MILSKHEFLALKPLLALLQENEALTLRLSIAEPANSSEHARKVEVELNAAATYIKVTRHGGPPECEFYRTLMGLAMAYRMPLAAITNQTAGE